MMRSADKGVGEATALELWTLCEVVGVVESFKIVQTSILQSLLSSQVFWFRPCRRCVKTQDPTSRFSLPGRGRPGTSLWIVIVKNGLFNGLTLTNNG